MGTTQEGETELTTVEVLPRGEITVVAPEGSHFEWDEVSTQNGKVSLGEHPVLVWDTVAGLVNHVGEEGVITIVNGTSWKVTAQAFMRRGALTKKTDNQIAEMQINYRPGTRVVGESTPISRAANAAKRAAAATGGGDQITALLEAIARGDSAALAALASISNGL